VITEGNGTGRQRAASGLDDPVEGTFTAFRVDPERTALVLVARSNAGPITFGATGLEGSISAQVTGGEVGTGIPPSARLEVPVQELTCGNGLYDAELHRRVDARLYPRAVVELRDASPVGATGRFHVEGMLTFHGVSRSVAGSVKVSFPEPGRIVVDGEQMLDMRHFEITPPAVAMLRIYPEVRVQLHVEGDVTD
jgi:hypothetical protein